jgi:hypothetical protein
MKAHLDNAHLTKAKLLQAFMDGAWLPETDLEGADLYKVTLKKAHMYKACLKGVRLYNASLKLAELREAHLEEADLTKASLEEANLVGAHLEDANLEYAHLEGADLLGAHLEGARCCRAFFDAATRLNGVILSNENHGSASLAEVSWGGVNLTVVNWSPVKLLGDEYIAQQSKDKDGKEKDGETQISEYQRAVRANRQLAVALQAQGMDDEASHYGYRGQRCKQRLLLLRVLQGLAERPKLRWIVHKPTKPSGYLYLLSSAMVLVSTALLFLYVFINVPRMISAVGIFGYIMYGLMAFTFLFVLSIVAYYLIIYQLKVRLVIIFLFISLLYLTLLFFALFFLIYIVASPHLLSLLFGMLLLVLLFGSLLMSPTTPEVEKSGLDPYRAFLYGQDETVRLRWKNTIKFFQKVYSSLRPFLNLQTDYGRYIFSLFLDFIAGYGYKPGRSLFWYFVVVFGFTVAYHLFGKNISLIEAFVLSITSFHGRGFFPGLGNETSLYNPLGVLAAIEAVIGLIIEISFIATFTQRFFGK